MTMPSVPAGTPDAAELAPLGSRASSSYLYPLIATVVLFAVWELATRFGNISPLILPAPSKILATAVDHFPVLMRMSAVTAYEFVLGFGLAAIIGLPLGALIVYSRPIEMTFYPMLVAFQTIPKAAIAPIFIVWLGTGQVIAGWDQGIVGMKAGGLRRLIIPGDLAYGRTGAGNSIPPNATLVFDIELLSVF